MRTLAYSLVFALAVSPLLAEETRSVEVGPQYDAEEDHRGNDVVGQGVEGVRGDVEAEEVEALRREQLAGAEEQSLKELQDGAPVRSARE
mgnify:CR=1 FL=1